MTAALHLPDQVGVTLPVVLGRHAARRHARQLSRSTIKFQSLANDDYYNDLLLLGPGPGGEHRGLEADPQSVVSLRHGRAHVPHVPDTS